MATTVERLSIVETKVQNLDEKVDDLKTNVQTGNTELKNQLEKMYDASCSQHAALSKEIESLKKEKDRWVWAIGGAIAILGWLSGHTDKVLSLFI